MGDKFLAGQQPIEDGLAVRETVERHQGCQGKIKGTNCKLWERDVVIKDDVTSRFKGMYPEKKLLFFKFCPN